MSYYRCKACNVDFSLEIPDCSCVEKIQTLARKSDEKWSHQDMYSEIADLDLSSPIQESQSKLGKARDDYDRIMGNLKHRSAPKVLEVGPGTGELARLLSDICDLYLADLTDEYLQIHTFAKGRFICDIEELPFHNEFDVVVVCDVLEHVLNEADALLSIRRALKDGGILFARAPANEPSVSYAKKLGSSFPYVHLRTYSKQSFVRILHSCGFRVKTVKYSWPVPISYARRSFFIPGLRRQQELFHTRELINRLPELRLNRSPRIIQALRFVENLTYFISRNFLGSHLDKLLDLFWFRPSEVVAVAIKDSTVMDIDV